MNRPTGSVRRILPSSTSIITATPTTGFVIDMMRKMVSFCIGFFDSRSISPCASKCATRPLRATSVTAPLKVLPSMWRCISSVTRFSRSADNPTSSGRAVGVDASRGMTSASATRSHRVRFT
jgi:hypothetical protein